MMTSSPSRRKPTKLPTVEPSSEQPTRQPVSTSTDLLTNVPTYNNDSTEEPSSTASTSSPILQTNAPTSQSPTSELTTSPTPSLWNCIPNPARCACRSDQTDYRGTIAITTSGRTCQRWDDQSPHSHPPLHITYPNAGLDENYCRNPDGEDGAWCYTTDVDVRWELCTVPSCDEDDEDGSSTSGDTDEDVSKVSGGHAVF